MDNTNNCVIIKKRAIDKYVLLVHIVNTNLSIASRPSLSMEESEIERIVVSRDT